MPGGGGAGILPGRRSDSQTTEEKSNTQYDHRPPCSSGGRAADRILWRSCPAIGTRGVYMTGSGRYAGQTTEMNLLAQIYQADREREIRTAVRYRRLVVRAETPSRPARDEPATAAHGTPRQASTPPLTR